MEMILLVGIQASGKSTYYRRFFFETHVQIGIDMLFPPACEGIILKACLMAGQPVVIDNVLVTAARRQKYILLATKFDFRVVAYVFKIRLADALIRNEKRERPCVAESIRTNFAIFQEPSISENIGTIIRVN